jgi:hypothetical protein
VLAAEVVQGRCIVVAEIEVAKLATAGSRRWRILRLFHTKSDHFVTKTEHFQ